LEGNPQKRGLCRKNFKLTPKKPCSARRYVCRILLCNRQKIFCHVPGECFGRVIIPLYKEVLIRSGRPNDLPGVRYRLIRGGFINKSTHILPVPTRRSCPSKYGIRNIRRIYKVRITRGKGLQTFYK